MVDIKTRTALLIVEKFSVSRDYADRLASAALDGIDAHGGDPNDWEQVVGAVDVVVRSWIGTKTFAQTSN